MSITIRPLQDSDRTGWAPLWADYLEFYESSDQISEAQTNHLWDILISDSQEIMGFGAFEDTGKLIGITHFFYHQTTWYKEGYCYLEDLFVDPSIRGKGVGEKLIEAVKTQAKKDGRVKLYWMTQHENFRARGLYNKVAGSSPAVIYEMDI